MADSDIFVSNDVQLDVDFGTMYIIDQGVAVKIIADKYAPTKTYVIGDYVVYSDLLYKCITAISEPEEFNSEKWTNIKIATEIEQINNSVSQKADKNNVYDKPTIDTKVDVLNDAIALKANANDVYTKSETYNQIEVDSALDTKADKSNTYVKDEVYNKTQVDSIINNLPVPMIFKGTLGTNGTITNLPVASSDNEGFTYKVITDGTYASISAKVGDMFTSNGSAWIHIPSGDETFTDTWRSIKVNGTEQLTDSITSGSVNFKNGTNSTAVFDPSDNSIKFNIDGYTQSQTDTKLADKADKSNTYTQTEVDNLIKNAISDLMPVDTASGAIATFETNMADLLQEVKCEINATGGNGTPENPIPINGYTEANITRCGVNLFDKTEVMDGYISDANGNYTYSNNRKCTDYIPIKGGESYKILSEQEDSAWGAWYDSEKNYISGCAGYYVGGSTVKTAPANACFVRLTIWSKSSGNIDTFGLNYPATDTSYTPYTGNTYAIAFGQTVYGGVLDVTRGKLSVTWTIIDLGDETLNYSYNSTYHRFDCSNDLGAKPAPDNVTPANAISSCYKNGCVSDVGEDDKFFYIAPASGNGKLRVVDTDYSDVATFKAAVAGQKVAFELATPFDIDLTPEVISAVVGTNNVYSDTNGDTTVKFKDSIQHYIDKHIT